MACRCNQCEPECDGATNCKCYACGLPVCRNCSRMLADKCRKGAYSRVCLNCANEWPERYGFRPKGADRIAYPMDADYYWSATAPEFKGSPKKVLAMKVGLEVAHALMDSEDDSPFKQQLFAEPPYRRFK